MEDIAKADTVRKAMRDAGLDDKMVSAFDEADLLKLYAGGYKTSVSFESAREQDLRACGLPPGLIGVLIRGARVQGELSPIRIVSLKLLAGYYHHNFFTILKE